MHLRWKYPSRRMRFNVGSKVGPLLAEWKPSGSRVARQCGTDYTALSWNADQDSPLLILQLLKLPLHSFHRKNSKFARKRFYIEQGGKTNDFSPIFLGTSKNLSPRAEVTGSFCPYLSCISEEQTISSAILVKKENNDNRRPHESSTHFIVLKVAENTRIYFFLN